MRSMLGPSRASCVNATCAPDKPWLVTAERLVNFGQADEQSDQLARGFAALGIAAGDTVLLMLPDTVRMILPWCALAKLGAIEVPINTHLKGAILTHMINDSRVSHLIVGVDWLDGLESPTS